MTLNAQLRRIQRNIEDYGWWVSAKKSLSGLFSPVYVRRVYRLYRIDLEIAQTPKAFGQGDFTFRVLNPDDSHMIEQIENFAEFLRGDLANDIAAEYLCLAALHGEQVAGFNLIAFGGVFIPLIELKRLFRQGSAWSKHIAVHRDFRRRGLGSQLRYRVFDELRKRGIKRLYGGTLRSNLANLRLSRKVGFREFVDVEYVRVLHFRSWRYRRLRE